MPKNPSISIALAQCNPTVGDIDYNVQLIRDERAAAAKQGAHVVVFPELAVTGYPPEDMVLRPAFQRRAMRAVQELAGDTKDGGPAMLVGGIWVGDDKQLYNAIFYLADGDIQTIQSKVDLPNYGVFDEARVFHTNGTLPKTITINGIRVGVIICEDTWTPRVARALMQDGAEILISSNASPYEITKAAVRRNIVGARVEETGLPMLYLNIVGGQDEIVFDGGSFIMDAKGHEIGTLAQHESDMSVTTWEKKKGEWAVQHLPHRAKQSKEESMYQTLVLGLKDYIRKTRMPGVLLGLSGGIDSALTAAIAVDALGADKVRCFMLPSKFTSQDSLDDAAECAKLLGVQLDTIPIEAGVEAMHTMLHDEFTGKEPNVTEENIQSRIRGNLLMAISNKSGWVVLNTGNKSELAVGYCTLYGDMCGALSVLKDVYKTQAYYLAEWRNAHHAANLLGPKGRVIAQNCITKEPTAELRENQRDADSLPPYEEMDLILHGLIEEKMSVNEVVRKGYAREVVEKVNRLLYIAEYKRRQAPPGVKITSMVFGKDWRYPIAQQFDN